MIDCNPIKEDYFDTKTLELQKEYFDGNYINSANLANKLLIDISKYNHLMSVKRLILSYKRLSDFQIEDYFLKTKIKIF